ncbi:hypothetical protein M6B38_393415 [Iris pallida]|uniref:Uncharacterized protein n=1 Tax=Iris pallida TaxID=29817 RepID=A0AAX6FY26_IRIPA|nr:hypothetical protein M6B38_393415 [Iris pallida]
MFVQCCKINYILPLYINVVYLLSFTIFKKYCKRVILTTFIEYCKSCTFHNVYIIL